MVGPEELLVDRAVSAVLSAVRLADADANVRDLPAAGLEPGTVTGLASPSLFGERQVIVVRGLHDAADEMITELELLVEAADPDVVLVLVHRGGPRGKRLLDAARRAGADEVACREVKFDNDKIAFVRAEISGAGRQVTAEAARALVEAVGSDLRELASACNQLVEDTDGRIDEQMVERYHGGRVETSGFKVADRALEGRADEALGMLRHALSTGAAPVLVTSALAMGLRNVARVSTRRGGRAADVARELGLAPFMVDKARRQLGGWGPEGLSRAILAVASADAEVKGAEADPVYALERAVVAIARARDGR